MGGTIAAKSRVGVGSTFWFTLRLPLQSNRPVRGDASCGIGRVRVLIVDDNSVNRLVLQEQVRAWKMRIGSCVSGVEALRTLREAHAAGNPYHIAILDYQMPEMDGETLGQLIKRDPLLHDIELIMLSSTGTGRRSPGAAQEDRFCGLSGQAGAPVRTIGNTHKYLACTLRTTPSRPHR